MKTRSLLFSVLIVGFFTTKAQSLEPTVIASDGGFSVVTGGSLSWTIGEPISETYNASGNFLTQGFQQPSIMLVSANDPTVIPDLFVYPNPASSELFIDPKDLGTGMYSVQLFDLLGNLISSNEFTRSAGVSSPWSLSLLDLSNGMYMIRIASSSFEFSTRIIKTK